jgi:hypothetical protein
MRSILLLLLASTILIAGDRPGQADITYLLGSMESSGCRFIRNGKEYEGKAAAAHLRTKLERAGDRVKTVDDFIDGIASRSSTTGEQYQVKKPDGKTVAASAWFRETLKTRSQK